MSRTGLRLAAFFLATGMLLSSCSAVEDAVSGAVSEVAADSAGAALDLLLQPACATVMVPLDGYERLAALAAQNQDVQQLRALITEYLAPMSPALSIARSTFESVNSSKTTQLLRDLGVLDEATRQAQKLTPTSDAQAVLNADAELRTSIGAIRASCATV